MQIVKQELQLALARSIESLVPGAGDKAVFETPKVPSHGDLAITAAMPLAKALKKNPRELATALKELLAKEPAFERWVEGMDIA